MCCLHPDRHIRLVMINYLVSHVLLTSWSPHQVSYDKLSGLSSLMCCLQSDIPVLMVVKINYFVFQIVCAAYTLMFIQIVTVIRNYLVCLFSGVTLSAGSNFKSKPKDSSGKKWFRRADTNVVSVSFSTLLSPSHMHAGDPVVCSSCQGILSHISKTEGDMENKVGALLRVVLRSLFYWKRVTLWKLWSNLNSSSKVLI